ncbi:hypothetical protein Q4578_18390 [Shimia thalassica]|uniref:hypothetical protein n=1 Tax=Shimia thalassica TaxID=1715693 RepID=UPI0026E1880C|nr:hypothetical protein [Shimia thalassica]MDO6523569.1 hypothetical protein [Shimia thalassica]
MSSVSIPTRRSVMVLFAAIVLTGFVIIVVNFQIYQARILYIAAYPELTAAKPPTISGAIRDPAIGNPFAVWISISAVFLFFGVGSMIAALWAEGMRSDQIPAKERRWLTVLSLWSATLQLMACVGMVILSNYRFPDYNDEHMFGSYLFFFSQAFVVVFVEITARRFAKQPERNSVILPAMMRVRRKYVWVPIFLGVAYLVLFLIKNYDLGAFQAAVFQTYVITEPLLITSFLLYNLIFHADMWGAILRYRRA